MEGSGYFDGGQNRTHDSRRHRARAAIATIPREDDGAPKSQPDNPRQDHCGDDEAGDLDGKADG
jgi:hypothetical protein